MKILVRGIPRGYQFPRADGNWLQPKHRAQILSAVPGADLLEIPAERVTGVDLDGIEIGFVEGGNAVHYPGELDWADYEKLFSPGLRWVQLCSTGFTENVTPQILSGAVTLTNAPGLHTIPIAESVVAAMLQHAKHLGRRARNQQLHAWHRLDNDELSGRTVLLIGLGRIGQKVAQLCHAFDMRVIGTRRTVAPIAGIELVFPSDQLPRELPAADYIVIAAPHTPESEHLIDAAAFAAMKPTAYLINVGRGKVVDEAAMLNALHSNRIAGAYLDAFAQEPLPAGHPFWNMPNVLLVPHDSHSSPYIGDRLVDMFCANLRRYVAGEPLLNVCDPRRGY
nr:D-isomer specific 2-hydroxyacid dehydrogenase, NAD binding domain protein [uncultured bacterium]